MSAQHSLVDRAIASAPQSTRAALRPLSLRHNFAWTLAGNLVYSGAQFGMLVLLGRLGGPALQGRFALALALCAPVVMFTNLQLRVVQATDARDEYSFRDFLGLRLLSSGAAYMVIAAMAWLSHYRAEVVGVILLVGAAKTAESVSDIIWGLWQKQERLDLAAISMMIKGVASLVVVFVVLSATRNLVYATAGLFVTWACLLLTYDVGYARWVLRRLPPAASTGRRGPAAWRQLAWVALPLGVVGLLDSLNVNVPRYLIEHQLGEAALGYFALFAYVAVVGNTIVGALAQSASARLSRHFVHNPAGFVRLTWRLVAFGIVLGGVGVLAAATVGRPLLSRLGPGYAAQTPVLVWMMVAAGFGYIARFVIISATAARAFRAQAPLYALSLAIVAVSSWWMIPRWGLLGAAWAVGAAMVALLLGATATLEYARRGPREMAPGDEAERRNSSHAE